MSLLEQAKSIQTELVSIRRTIHENAEVGFELPKTIAFVKGELEKLGLKPVILDNSGMYVLLKGEKPGKTFLLRADMDALPMDELSGEEFACNTGAMHACGHDMHTTMLLGATKLLVENKSDIEGTIVLFFQPAEELLAGAKRMIEAGLLDQTKPDAAAMIHVMSGLNIPAGKFGMMNPGPAAASHDRFEINIVGVGCHGAMPNQGVDPIVTMTQIHNALALFQAREVQPGEFLVATTGIFKAGSAQNIIPGTGQMVGTLRTFNPKVREFAKQRIEELSVNIGKAYRSNVKVDFSASCPAMSNDPLLLEQLTGYIEEIAGKDAVIQLSDYGFGKMAGSEDFGYIAAEVPAVMLTLTATTKTDRPMHHPEVVFDENVLQQGAAVYAGVAINWLKNNK